MKRSIFIILIIMLLPSVCLAENRMFPTISERLDNLITLKHCPAKIVEWKGSSYNSGSYPSKLGIVIMESVCKIAHKRFDEFLKEKNIKVPNKKPKLNIKISLLPADVSKDGLEPRNLNDVYDRFNKRGVFFTSSGQPGYLNGYYSRSEDYMFVRNDVLIDGKPNPEFVRVFSHEIFHAMSDQYGVYDSLSNNAYKRMDMDEVLADEFSKYFAK